MKATISRCDICGADDSPDNPVNVKVTGVNEQKPRKKKRDSQSISPFGFSICYGEAEPCLDLCQACGGGLVQILRSAHPAKPSKPQPAPQTITSQLIAAMAKNLDESIMKKDGDK